MTKMANFPVELGRYIRRSAGRKYEWGTFDCCTWAADWSVMACGIDICQPFRGEYTTYLQAMHVIRNYLGDSKRGIVGRQLLEHVCPLIADKFGLPEIPRSRIQTGDLVLLRLNNPVGGALGVCLQKDVFTPAHQGGLTQREMRHAQRAWRL